MTRAAEKINQLLIVDDDRSSPEPPDKFEVWFLKQFDDSDNLSAAKCCLEDFAVYFLNAVRTRAEVHLKTNETDAFKDTATLLDTPARSTHSGKKNLYAEARRNENSPQLQEVLNDSQQFESEERHHHSLNHSLKYNTSTPLRRVSSSSSINSSHGRPVSRHSVSSFNNRSCITPNSLEKTRNNGVGVGGGGGGGGSSICLGDFFLPSTPNNNKNNNSKKTTTTAHSAGKPKKRVVPTTISSPHSVTCSAAAPFGNNSAFSNENNILKISSSELDDKDKCSILEARASLKQRAKEISRELENSMVETKQTLLASSTLESGKISNQFNYSKLSQAIRMQSVEERRVIERIAAIYSTLMDMNFTTNILNEISFLINILNANTVFRSDGSIVRINLPNAPSEAHFELPTLSQKSPREKTKAKASESMNPNGLGLDLLQTALNCVHFALCVLNKQRSILAMLDLKSLRVVLYSECLLSLSDELKLYLESVYQRKQHELQEAKKRDCYFPTLSLTDRSFNNVYYQEDRDSRQNFPSNTEFGAFKSQRDLFYKALKYWESNHLNLAFNFQQEIAPRIREIFKLSEHPINMAHFAELFASQLLISANYASSPEEIGVDIDLQKFSKLSQRLTAPSNFSVGYQFPYNQAFFRDFIFEARSIAFLEPLKLVVYNKLIVLNDSAYDLLSIFKDDENHVDEHLLPSAYIVRPEVLSSLQVLAKFLGFITVLPFKYSNISSTITTPTEELPLNLQKTEIELRSLLQSNLNMDRLLKAAIKDDKILITLPWMVQYLSMLDNVSLQLDCYAALLRLMFGMFKQLDAHKPAFSCTAAFIIRCCLGWLFDSKPIITEQYYNYRMSQSSENASASDDIIMQLDASHLFSPPAKICHSDQTDLNLLLESILDVACPFLAEFRVSIMPAKCTMVKYVSRSGRYRYITTRISELQSSNEHKTKAAGNANAASPLKTLRTNKETCHENKLTEAFLHSQSSTVRHLLEFITERIYKSTIRDAQFHILMPTKNCADRKIDHITSSEYTEVYKALQTIFQEARLTAVKQWEATVPGSIKKRITSALDSLLPQSTEAILKQAYFHLIHANSLTKIDQWCQANIFSSNFYCSSVQELTQKICRANSKAQQEQPSATPTPTSSELVIKKLTPSTSHLLDELQFLLHATSLRPENVSGNATVLNFLQQLPLVFDNILPTNFYRVVATGTVLLLQNLIARHTDLVTVEVIDAFQSLWSTSEMKKYTPPNKCDDGDNQSKANGVDDLVDHETIAYSTPGLFDGLITISFIDSLGATKACFDKLTQILLTLIRENLITLDLVNSLFVPIFKWDWHPSVLNEISIMLQRIAREGRLISQHKEEEGRDLNDDHDHLSYDDMKSNLFIEVLADFARDVDNF